MPYVYQASDGQWVVYSNGSKKYFATQMEAMNMSNKLEYAIKIQEFARDFSLLVLELPDLKAVWDDREYLAGSDGKAITDADVESLGITVADLAAFISPFTTQLGNFMNNAAVMSGDFSVTLNKLRTDM